MTSAALEACATSGNAEAQTQLGMRYWSVADRDYFDAASGGFGETLTQDEARTQGRRWIESAARQGSSVAQNELGYAYLEGLHGVSRDQSAAKYWLELADTNGDAYAAYNLARIYYGGLGVTRNPAYAEALLSRSASRGYGPAYCAIAIVYDRRGDGISAQAVRLVARFADRDVGCEYRGQDMLRDFPP